MRLAISMPVAGNIVFMTLKTRKILSKIIPNSISFTKDKTVSVGIGCTGLAFTSGHLVVCYADGYDSKKSQSRVQIVDLAGNILKKIPNDTLNEQLFQQATDVAVSPDQTKIYVSDSSDNALVLVSQDGTVTKVISDTLFEPMGISVDEDGLVYVCAGGKLHQVAPDLSTVREITITGDNADRIVPLSLVYCIVTKRLFVGFEKNIKVFKKIK
jgi:DNA-binding beta-propeller fold protein YncE